MEKLRTFYPPPSLQRTEEEKEFYPSSSSLCPRAKRTGGKHLSCGSIFYPWIFFLRQYRFSPPPLRLLSAAAEGGGSGNGDFLLFFLYTFLLQGFSPFLDRFAVAALIL